MSADPAVRFSALFPGRTDVQGTEGGGCLRRHVTLGHYRGHLQGRFGLGVYPLRDDGTCAWAVVDVDRNDLDAVLLLRRLLGDAGLHAVVLTSRSKGFHVIVFVAGASRASHLRHILHTHLMEAGLPPSTEIYPRRGFPAVDSVAPGGYLRLPYLAAIAPAATKLTPPPGRRVAIDPVTLRPLPFIDFLDQAEAARASPELVRELGETEGADEEEADGRPRALPTLPGDPTALGLSSHVADLIQRGWSPDSDYGSRSEAQQAVADALVNAGHEDAIVQAVLLHPTWGIAERTRGLSASRAEDAVARCIAKARATIRPSRPANELIPSAVHRLLIERRLPALAWPVLAEIAATTDSRTGVSIVTPESLARRLGRSRASVYRDALEPLRQAGLLESVDLGRLGGRWTRIGHRLALPPQEVQESVRRRSVSPGRHGGPQVRAGIGGGLETVSHGLDTVASRPLEAAPQVGMNIVGHPPTASHRRDTVGGR